MIVLSYNVEKSILRVLREINKLGVKIFVIDDKSKDKSKLLIEDFIQSNNKIELIENKKNLGAGASLKKALIYADSKNFDVFIKVDGDDQFLINDIESIYNLLLNEDYDFIKSNRFWSDGIVGKIPFHRLVGNIIATLMMHISTGTNKLYDPLNGLFGGNISIIKFLDSRYYPKRYGYPFFFITESINNYLKIFQFNNTIKYADEKSNLKTLRVFLTLLSITLRSFLNKIKFKTTKDTLQFSAFLDIVFILFSILFIFSFGKTFSYYFIPYNDGNQGQWLIIGLFFLFSSVFIFNKSFKIESITKNKNIYIK